MPICNQHISFFNSVCVSGRNKTEFYWYDSTWDYLHSRWQWHMSTSVLSLFPLSSFCLILTHAVVRVCVCVFSSDNTNNGWIKIAHQWENTSYSLIFTEHTCMKTHMDSDPTVKPESAATRWIQRYSHLRTPSTTVFMELRTQFSGRIKWIGSVVKNIIYYKEYSSRKL